MTMEIFWGSGSPFSWRVLLTAELKGADYESRLIEFSSGEHKSPQFLEMNPRGKVPALRNGDFTLSESLAIMTYLDRLYPDPPLFGESPEEAGWIMRALCDCMLQVDTRLDRLVRPAFMGTLEDSLGDAEDAASGLASELARIDREMSVSTWWLGEVITAADIFLYPGLQLMERVLPKAGYDSLTSDLLPLPEKFTHIGRWEKLIEALPFFERTYPPHWKA